MQSSKDSLDSQQPGSPVACDSLKDPVHLLNDSSVIPSSSFSVPAEVHSLHGDADVKICSSPEESALQVAIAAQPGDNSLHSPPTPDPGKSDITTSRTQSSDCSPTGNSLPSSQLGTPSNSPELGSVVWLSAQPGSFVRYEGKNGETILWPKYPYTDLLIPVLHHGAIGCGVDKCDLCRFDLDGDGCRRGARCTYAHGWSERVEWICPVCTQLQKMDCESKWQHILKYQRIGVYVVDDGRTVANFLDDSS